MVDAEGCVAVIVCRCSDGVIVTYERREWIDLYVICIEFVLLNVWVCCVKCSMKLNSIRGINRS